MNPHRHQNPITFEPIASPSKNCSYLELSWIDENKTNGQTRLHNLRRSSTEVIIITRSSSLAQG